MTKTLMCLFTVVNAVIDGDGAVLMQAQDASASLSLDMAGLQVDSQFTKLEESLHTTLLDVLKDPETMKRLPKKLVGQHQTKDEGDARCNPSRKYTRSR
jgi:hypothetical protein